MNKKYKTGPINGIFFERIFCSRRRPVTEVIFEVYPSNSRQLGHFDFKLTNLVDVCPLITHGKFLGKWFTNNGETGKKLLKTSA